MSSRLFKHQVVAARKIVPNKLRLIFGQGDLFEVDTATNNFKFLANLPQTIGSNDTLWSPDNKFIVFCPAQSGHTYKLYRDDGNNVWTSVALPGWPSGASAYTADWSKDGKYLYVGISVSPYLLIYRREANNTFTLLSSPAVIAAATLYACRVSPKNDYLVTSSSAAPWLIVYKINTDGTLTAITSANPAAYAWLSVTWLSDYIFTYLSDGNRPARAYSINTQLNQLADVTISAFTTFAWAADISKDGKYIVATEWGGNGVMAAKINSVATGGVSLTLITPPRYPNGNVMGGQSARGVEFSPDGKMLILASASGQGGAYVYRRDGDAFTSVSGPASFSSGANYSSAFSN